MYTIRANNKTYRVGDHAAYRMIQRNIQEEWLIETLEQGDMTSQANERDKYELQKWIDDWQEWLILQVIVKEDVLLIITVIDDTIPLDENE